MKSYITRRAFLFSLLVVSSFMGQWWMPLVLGVGILLFESAYEVLAIGVLLDIVYAPLGGGFFIMYFLTFLVTWLVGELLRKRLLLR